MWLSCVCVGACGCGCGRTAIAPPQVRKEHQAQLNQFVENTRSMYSDAAAAARKWGGGVMGNKAQVKVAKRDKALARERASIKA